MAVGKWIADLKATTPVADAARHVLTVRLESVRDALPLALREADRDPEYVHRLRVGTRRASAAVEIFACCLPSRKYKAARRQLRGIRRLAGEARDWDIFLAGLTQKGLGPTRRRRPALDCLVGYAVARREAAQHRLEEAGEDYPFAFEQFLAETVADVQKPHEHGIRNLLDLALSHLWGLLGELEEAASGPLDDCQHLHRVRIVGKRLRYAMEVFADCFAPPFREELYPALVEMQEILGNANDSHVACCRLEAFSKRLQAQVPKEWNRFRPGLESLSEDHQFRLAQERRRFQDWWARWCDSAGEKAAFSAVLKSASDSLSDEAPSPTIRSVPASLPRAV
jgi:CHAD domain-containing protein